MPSIKEADQFVQKVTFAQAWRGNPRYLACLRNITTAIPEDKQTYATNITIKENAREKTPGAGGTIVVSKGAEGITLSGQLYLKTTDQKSAKPWLTACGTTRRSSK